jgi:hypothetical protein
VFLARADFGSTSERCHEPTLMDQKQALCGRPLATAQYGGLTFACGRAEFDYVDIVIRPVVLAYADPAGSPASAMREASTVQMTPVGANSIRTSPSKSSAKLRSMSRVPKPLRFGTCT